MCKICKDQYGKELQDDDTVTIDNNGNFDIRLYNDELYFSPHGMVQRVSAYDKNKFTKITS